MGPERCKEGRKPQRQGVSVSSWANTFVGSSVKYIGEFWLRQFTQLARVRKEHTEHRKKYYGNKSIFWSRSNCILTVLRRYIKQQERPE